MAGRATISVRGCPSGRRRHAAWTRALAYRGGMGKLLLVLLAVFAAFLVVSLVISALHFLFVVALVTLVVVGALRLTSSVRRRRARW
jgi:Flp pilus assembly protein TadB